MPVLKLCGNDVRMTRGGAPRGTSRSGRGIQLCGVSARADNDVARASHVHTSDRTLQYRATPYMPHVLTSHANDDESNAYRIGEKSHIALRKWRSGLHRSIRIVIDDTRHDL